MGNFKSSLNLICVSEQEDCDEITNEINNTELIPAYLMARAYGLFLKEKTLFCHIEEIHMMNHEYYSKVIFPRFLSNNHQNEVKKTYENLNSIAKKADDMIKEI